LLPKLTPTVLFWFGYRVPAISVGPELPLPSRSMSTRRVHAEAGAAAAVANR
jgi:hypothetical protein